MDAAPETVERIVKETRVLHFVDASAQLLTEDISLNTIYGIDGHPNARANRVFAAQIHAYLVGNGLVPQERE